MNVEFMVTRSAHYYSLLFVILNLIFVIIRLTFPDRLFEKYLFLVDFLETNSTIFLGQLLLIIINL